MGFFKSLTRELGRNTGKWVSNKVFKDSWSTPYRFSRTQTASTESKRAAKAEPNETSPRTSNASTSQDPLLVNLRNLDVPDQAADLTDQLEFLLGVLVEHQGTDEAHKKIRSLARTKYRLGLHRLEVQDPQAAQYFKSEWNGIRRKSVMKVVWMILAFAVLMVLALIVSEA